MESVDSQSSRLTPLMETLAVLLWDICEKERNVIGTALFLKDWPEGQKEMILWICKSKPTEQEMLAHLSEMLAQRRLNQQDT